MPISDTHADTMLKMAKSSWKTQQLCLFTDYYDLFAVCCNSRSESLSKENYVNTWRKEKQNLLIDKNLLIVLYTTQHNS